MALHVDVTLQIEGVTEMLEDAGQAAVKHCGRRATADVEGGDGPLAHDNGVKVNLPLDRPGIPFCHITAVELLVVGAVGADLLAKGDMKIEAQLVDRLELLAEFPA
jgi:hypothetical protein